MDTTLDLLRRAHSGERDAVEQLFARYSPVLRRWAAGRLPRHARDLAETGDLVQETLLKVFQKLDAFEYRGEGAFLAYLRQALMNRIRNETRHARRTGARDTLDERIADPGLSPFEEAVGRLEAERYEDALTSLSEEERALIVGRLELGLSWAEVAAATGKASSDAARVATSRAVARLAERLQNRRTSP